MKLKKLAKYLVRSRVKSKHVKYQGIVIGGSIMSLWVMYLHNLYEKKRDGHRRFVLECTRNVDIQMLKAIFRENVIAQEGEYEDLSEKVSTTKHPDVLMRRIDFILCSKSYKKDKPREKWISSIVHKNLIDLQFALKMIRSLDDPNSHDPIFYNAKVGLHYIACYIHQCDYQLPKNNPANQFLKKVNVDTFGWACEYFYPTYECNNELIHIRNMMKYIQKIQ